SDTNRSPSMLLTDLLHGNTHVCIASVARTVLRAVRDSVVSVARAVWNWIFF
ncbi:hypothetical protein M3I60_21815, partial [Escherichia coli]|nr:hypothetical protein [Escherichia coli]